MVKPISINLVGNKFNTNQIKSNNYLLNTPIQDVACFSTGTKQEKLIDVKTIGNVTHISFKGQLNNPIQPSIQMKVRGVSVHQRNFGDKDSTPLDRNIENLANSDWYDGKKLRHKIEKIGQKEKVVLYDEDFGEIGRVPEEITPQILDLLKDSKKDYQFTLSNVIAGMTKGAATIGLRVNLICTSNNPKVKKQADRTFDELLNSPSAEIKDCIMQYQPKTSPEEILGRIFDVNAVKYGLKETQELKGVVKNIVNEIKDDKNQNILLIGHNLPDGDTIGCVLGMEAAIKANYPEKNVDCAIDDKLPGLYRDKLPNIDKIKIPYNFSDIEQLHSAIEYIKTLPHSRENKYKVKEYRAEIARLSVPDKYFDFDVAEGEEPKKYDLVILMDVPSPSRFTSAFKPYLENAGKVIYIDHHPYQHSKWQEATEETGLDMQKVQEDNLAFVVEQVPAATQLVSAISSEAGLLDNLFDQEDYAKQFVAGIVSGMSSDTGSFIRTANFTPEDIKSPVKERPNFLPEGLSKWFIDKLGNKIDKKWLRENIVYDISDKSNGITDKSPREKMINYAIKSRRIEPDVGVGFISMSYEDLYDIWETAKKEDKKITFADVQNSIKYSEVMGALRESPKLNGGRSSGISTYKSPYQDDKIAVLILQDKKAGELAEDSRLFDTNSLRLSIRSREGTNYAEMIAGMFGGGGHASAAGARIELPNINVKSKIALIIDGQLQTNPYKIYNALQDNYDIKHDKDIPEEDKSQQMHTIEVVETPEGKSIQGLITNVVKVMREYSNF